MFDEVIITLKGGHYSEPRAAFHAINSEFFLN